MTASLSLDPRVRPATLLGVPVVGRRVALERLSPRHAVGLHALLSSAELADGWPLQGNAVPQRQLVPYLGNMSRSQFTVVRRESGEVIGLVQAIAEDRRNGTLDVAVVVAGHLWRVGWPLEAFFLFADYLFRGLGYRKLYFSVPATVRRRLGRRIGEFLKLECVLTEHVFSMGRYEDLSIFAMDRDQWDHVDLRPITGHRYQQEDNTALRSAAD
jgi:RimJ/RimL family protein N-acetyltransferase